MVVLLTPLKLAGPPPAIEIDGPRSNRPSFVARWIVAARC
jgi:hypothetical protein